MKNRFEMTGSICQIVPNGDISFAPPSRNLIYLLIIILASAGAWLWVRALWPISAILILVSSMVVLVDRAGQPKVLISRTPAAITWRRGLRRKQVPFKNVSGVNVSLDRREYAWSAHLVGRRNIVEGCARLELILRGNGRLYLGRIVGENAAERAAFLAQTTADRIGVPVSTTGSAPKA